MKSAQTKEENVDSKDVKEVDSQKQTVSSYHISMFYLLFAVIEHLSKMTFKINKTNLKIGLL